MILNRRGIRRSMNEQSFIGPDRPHRPPPITAGGKNQGEAPRSSVIGCGLRLLFSSLIMDAPTLCALSLMTRMTNVISGDGH